MITAQAGSHCISSIAGQRYIGKPQVGYAVAKAGMPLLATAAAFKDNTDQLCCPGIDAYANVETYGRKICWRRSGRVYRQTQCHGANAPDGERTDVANAVLFLAADESAASPPRISW